MRHIAILLFVLLLLNPVLGKAEGPQQASGSYDACARSTYAALRTAWQVPLTNNSQSNFWREGNVFDSLVDYILLFESNPQNELAAIAPTAKQLYNLGLGRSVCWWDDLGWWGIAAAKMSKNVQNATLKADFKGMAAHTWNIMHTYAPNTYSQAESGSNSSYFKSLQPRFNVGGVWNYCWGLGGDPQKCWPGQSSMCGGGCDPRSPGNTLCGYQNTVTNSLYLVLSLRLYQLETDPVQKQHYLNAARSQFDWFRNWFGVADADTTLLASQSNGALVRERASTYANGSSVNNYNRATFWTGDQGLVLGGLVDYFAAEGDSYAQNVAILIASAIPQGLTDPNAGNLLPWKPGGTLQSWDCGDYSCGSGVFMRYLLYGFQNNTSVRNTVQGSPSYLQFIKTNGDLACSNNLPSFCGQSNTDLFPLLNRMATLNTAKAILP